MLAAPVVVGPGLGASLFAGAALWGLVAADAFACAAEAGFARAGPEPAMVLLPADACPGLAELLIPLPLPVGTSLAGWGVLLTGAACFAAAEAAGRGVALEVVGRAEGVAVTVLPPLVAAVEPPLEAAVAPGLVV